MKKLQIKSWILLLAVLLGGGSVWAEDATIASGTFDGKNETYTEGWTTTGTGKGRNDCVIIGSGENITSPAIDLSGYSKVTISIKARRYGSLSGSKATIDASIGGTSVGTTDAKSTNATTSLTDIVFTPTSSMTAATLVFTCTNANSAGSTHGAGINSITITGTPASINPDDPSVATTITIDATGITNTNLYVGTEAGSLSATVSAGETAVEGATVTWTSSKPEVATIGETTGVVTLVAAGKTTITASYAGVEGEYKSSTKTYELTVINSDPNANDGSAEKPFTVAEAIAFIETLGTATSSEDVYVSGIVSQVDSYNSNYSSITYWISDNGTTEGQMEVYSGKGLNGANFSSVNDLTVGDVVTVKGKVKMYGETPEFDKNNVLVSHVGKPAVPTFSPAAGTYTSGQSVTISAVEGATIYYTIDGTEPTTESSVYAEAIAVNATTTIKAIAVKDGKVSDVATAEFVIDLTPTIVFDGTTNPYNVSYEAGNTNVHYVASNITEAITLLICDSEGNSATYDWFNAELSGEYVAATWQANEDAENTRTAYFKLTAGSAESAIFAITQAKYVVDYAVLPFVFNGKKSDISSTTGLTQNGLGTDYNSAPYLKFDNTGDWVILKFNERPGKLSYGIEGYAGNNGLSGSKFTVQTSVDGVNYADLKTYQNAVGSYTETIDNLNENIRYIKWIYTEKVNGNVAIGDINLEKYVVPSTDPSIILSDNVINAPATGADGTITVTYNNITDVYAEVFFCDAEGVTATYDWIDAEINDENNVDYVIDANDGEARTAYMKVYALDDEANNVYSELITVTQAANVPTTNYTLATTLVPGKHYVIASGTEGKVYAMGKMKSTNREAVEVTVDNNVIALTGEEGAYEFLIQGPDKNGNYTIYDESEESTGYLYAAGGTDNNHLKVQATKDSNAEWSISIDSSDGEATIKAKMNGNSDDRNWMRFNNGNSKLFSCYKSGQEAIYLFEKVGEAAPTEETITISDVKYATYCSKNALDFEGTGVTAYVATMDGNTVKFNPVTKVPAYEGVLLKANAAGDFTIGTATSIDNEDWSNAFIGVTEQKTISETIFVLMRGDWEGGQGVGFYQTTSTFTVGAHTAYLPALAGGDGSRTFIGFDFNDATAIDGIAADTKTNGEVYNLQGQRVVKAQKGLYIMNGKKVLVK